MQISEGSVGAVGSTEDGYVFTQLQDNTKQFPHFYSKEQTERFFRW